MPKLLTSAFLCSLSVALTACGGGGDKASPSATVNTTAPVKTTATVSTLAGSGAIGADNGPGTSASFSKPESLAVDMQGNVYVADMNNHMIRKITPDGVVSTLAGSGVPGRADGVGTAASFDFPMGVAVDPHGNVYVADSGNNLIRMITPSGLVSTLAGSGAVMGSNNGSGIAASFSYPHGIAVSAQGNVYVGDTSNNLIRLITPTTMVSTLAGTGLPGSANGAAQAASFHYPWGVAVDAQGNVYVGDYGNNLIRKIVADGTVTTLAGSGAPGTANGIGTAASFNAPNDIAVDKQGNVYVPAPGLNQIRMVSPAGVVSTYAGSGSWGRADGSVLTASFNFPSSVAVDAQGNVYVADTGNNLIRKITPN